MSTFFPSAPDLASLVALAIAVFVAGFVRGFSGFGFSAIVVTSMAMLLDPLTVIAMVMVFEIVASTFQLVKIYPAADKPQVARLLAGALIGMPIGVSVLVALDINLVRMAISFLVLGLCVILLTGWSFKKPVGALGQFLVGGFSGVSNSAAIGGLPVGLFLTAQNTTPERFRATMIGYLFALDVFGIMIMAYYGKFSVDIVVTAFSLFPLMMAGVLLGSYQFFSTPPKSFRLLVIGLLIVLSLVGLAKSFL